jgi:hypothetical protein
MVSTPGNADGETLCDAVDGETEDGVADDFGPPPLPQALRATATTRAWPIVIKAWRTRLGQFAVMPGPTWGRTIPCAAAEFKRAIERCSGDFLSVHG